MNKLNEKKKRWIINQFKIGRSRMEIAKIQKVSRKTVYQLANQYDKFGNAIFQTKNPGRPRYDVNPTFIEKVKEIRKFTDYGSQKIHFTLKKQGFGVSQHIIQRILDEEKLTEPCPKRRGNRKYVRYLWPISNYMWHTDWSTFEDKEYCVYIDDCSRKIMAAGSYSNATQQNALLLLYQGIYEHNVVPIMILSDKGTQFYNAKRNNKGERPLSKYEKELERLGIEFWTSRRNHPQTNGKMEKWFDTMKKRFRKHPEETLPNFVKWYNKERIHHGLDYKTPEEVYWEKV